MNLGMDIVFSKQFFKRVKVISWPSQEQKRQTPIRAYPISVFFIWKITVVRTTNVYGTKWGFNNLYTADIAVNFDCKTRFIGLNYLFSMLGFARKSRFPVYSGTVSDSKIDLPRYQPPVAGDEASYRYRMAVRKCQ